MRISKRRRLEGKTDYKLRINILKSRIPRIVFRKTNRYVLGQYIKSEEAQDSVLIGVSSKSLIDFGWQKSKSIKNAPACYLTGFLLGKRIKEKFGDKKSILDLGMLRSINGSRIYAFAKGVVDSGIELRVDKIMFPKEERIIGRNLKKNIDFQKIKEKIEND